MVAKKMNLIKGKACIVLNNFYKLVERVSFRHYNIGNCYINDEAKRILKGF